MRRETQRDRQTQRQRQIVTPSRSPCDVSRAVKSRCLLPVAASGAGWDKRCTVIQHQQSPDAMASVFIKRLRLTRARLKHVGGTNQQGRQNMHRTKTTIQPYTHYISTTLHSTSFPSTTVTKHARVHARRTHARTHARKVAVKENLKQS